LPVSTLIFHPSVAPHVQQDARALLEAGLLEKLHTTLRYEPERCWQKTAISLARAVGYDFDRDLRRRRVTEIPAERVTSRPIGELVRLLSTKLDSSQRLGDLVWERTETGFDRHVARRYLTPAVTSVFGYEHSCLSTFERGHATGRRLIYNVPAPEPAFVQAMLERELEQFPELRTPFYRHTFAREERRAARRRKEWELAGLVIAASNFTRDTFSRAGRDTAKVAVVPLGAPPPVTIDEAANGGGAESARLSVLWAGTFSVRKGAHYLLDAWRRGAIGRHADLHIYGAIGLPDRLLHPLPEGVHIGGSIPRDVLMSRYRQSDVLVFPTLCDGFGMVATEAWSQGLPVIASDRAGCQDLVKDRENGLRVVSGDPDALIASIEWCLQNRATLRSMRVAARATAASWQWSDYRKALGEVVTRFLSAQP
jgi:glycosyltransferase involved in cell wall biosynthesis